LLRDGFLDETHGLPAADVDRDDRAGEEHRVPERQNRKMLRDLDRPAAISAGSALQLGHGRSPCPRAETRQQSNVCWVTRPVNLRPLCDRETATAKRFVSRETKKPGRVKEETKEIVNGVAGGRD